MFAEQYSKYYDLFNSKKPYKKEIEFIYKWADKPLWIFDIGCGTANYWKYYPEGTYMFGVDRSPSMANQSKHVAIADITTYKHLGRFDCATALFDVINYIPTHTWWKNLPIEQGKYFIFDIWNKKKVDKDGFKETIKTIGGITRRITPVRWDGKSVDLLINVNQKKTYFQEMHTMYLYSHADIMKFCGKEFEVIEVKDTKTWQKWYKLIKN